MKQKNKFKKYLEFWLPPLIWAFIIFSFSAQSVLPGFTISAADFMLKKTAHIFVYAVLYWLVLRALTKTTSCQKKNQGWWKAMILCLIYAISDELHQSVVPGRHASMRDVGFDLLGIALVFLKKFKYI
jgi:uncharacterized membrane protein SirB2